MTNPKKGKLLRARVSSQMKREIQRIAEARGESEAVILREAISDYIRRGNPPARSQRPQTRS